LNSLSPIINNMNKETAKRIAKGSLIGFIGFILSPVS